MKYLENANLESWSLTLGRNKANCLLDARLETYSCKMISQEKRLFKELLQAEGPGSTANDLKPLSPPDAEEKLMFSTSPGCSRPLRGTSSESEPDTDNAAGQLCDSVSHKTLFHLISTLNASFPDYDFTSAKGENFSRVPSVVVAMKAINMQLSAAVPSFAHMKPELWSAIDEKIDLKNCCVYNPLDYDPSDDSSLQWMMDLRE